MFIAATLCWEQHRNPVKLRNMSATGALVESAVVPPSGARVHLIRGSFSATGKVVWTSKNRCGVHMADRINVRDWLAPPANKEQQRVDQMVTLIKAGNIPLPASSLGERESSSAAPQSLTPDRLTSDLRLLARLIEETGDNLASEPQTLALHAGKLQNLDIALQMISAICSELMPDWEGQSRGIARMVDLRTSCAQALGRT
jgi:hypothetical protein